MEDLEKQKKEQVDLKEKLVKLIDFINSEEYFTLDETEKSLLMSQRVGMEIYLNSLTQRIYGARKLDANSSIFPLILMSMFNPFSPSPSSVDLLKEQLDKDLKEKEKKNDGEKN
jgi:hypothetical protein